jgi:hypothetical protein
VVLHAGISAEIPNDNDGGAHFLSGGTGIYYTAFCGLIATAARLQVA